MAHIDDQVVDYISNEIKWDDYKVIRFFNAYCDSCGLERERIREMREFDQFCEEYLSPTNVADAVDEGNFHTYHAFFRYKQNEDVLYSHDMAIDLLDDGELKDAIEGLLEYEGANEMMKTYGFSYDDLKDCFATYFSECENYDLSKIDEIPNGQLLIESWDEIAKLYLQKDEMEYICNIRVTGVKSETEFKEVLLTMLRDYESMNADARDVVISIEEEII